MASKKPNLSALITQLFTLKAQVDKLAAAKAVLDKRQRELEETILQSFTAAELSSARNALGQVTRVEDPVPQVDDWEKVYAWVKRTGRFEALHKRLSGTVWAEQLEAKKPIPGVSTFTRVYLKLTPAKKKAAAK